MQEISGYLADKDSLPAEELVTYQTYGNLIQRLINGHGLRAAMLLTKVIILVRLALLQALMPQVLDLVRFHGTTTHPINYIFSVVKKTVVLQTELMIFGHMILAVLNEHGYQDPIATIKMATTEQKVLLPQPMYRVHDRQLLLGRIRRAISGSLVAMDSRNQVARRT
jgi:hypothetical protein